MMMPMPFVVMSVVVAVTAVSSAFGLEGSMHFAKISSEAMEHLLDHMVRSNAENLVLDLSWQVPIAQMPSQAHELIGIFMPDFYDKLRCGLDLEPPAIVKLQAIAVGHGDCLGKVEKDILALVRGQTDATAMARVEIERKRACGFVRWPMSGATVKGSAMHRHIST